MNFNFVTRTRDRSIYVGIQLSGESRDLQEAVPLDSLRRDDINDC